MGSSKRNLLTSILLLVVMGVFAVLTIFIVVDAINKKYYNDIKVEYEVQEESPNIILTFARNEGSNFSTDNTKVMLNKDKTKFRIDGTVPTIENGVVTNLDDLTSNDGREFYFFSTNSSFIDPQEDPENPDFIFSETDSRYYVSTEDNPIWYDVPKSSENLTLYSVFLTPNVHNSDFVNAPLLNTSPNVIISHDVVDIPYNAFSDLIAYVESQGQTGAAKIESVVIPNSTKSINSEFDTEAYIIGGAFVLCTTLTNIIIPSSVEYVGSEAFVLCSGLETIKYGNGYYLSTESNEHAILIDTNIKAEDVTIHEDCISIQGGAFSKYLFFELGLIPPPDMGDGSNIEEILGDYINMNLQEITIPKNVKNIGGEAFMMCMGLENVVFEDNSDLTSIGAMSFGFCTRLKTINLEDTNLKELMGTFSYCSSLTSITIPDNVTSIGNSAFNGCSSLTSITIPESVTSIENYAFDDCSSLTSITIPDSVTSIGSYAFYNCSSLETVTFGENSQLTSIGNSAFNGCSSLTSITIPESVTSIENYAFRDCSSLTSITIPDSVTSIGSYAFSGCSSLTSITIPDSVTSIGDSAFSGCSSLTLITIPDSVTSIGDYAFRDCSSLESVDFGEGSQLTSIGNRVFYRCTILTSITIPDSVTSIGDSAFRDCSSLTSITIPDSVTSIGDYAFRYCYKLVEVYDLTGPEGLNITAGSSDNGYVGYYADYVYTDKDADLVQKVVGDYTFYYNNGVMYLLGYTGSHKELKLPSIDEVKEEFGDFGDTYEIYEYAFYENTNITSVVIPNCVTSIENYAFDDCSSLTSITIPDSVTSIGSSAFRYCYKLVEVYDLTGSEGLQITKGNTGNGYVGYYAVEIKKEEGVTGIYYTGDNNEFVMYKDSEENHYLVDYKGQGGNISLPTFDDARTYFINKYAFYENLTITSIEIPSSVTSIGSYAFYNCISLSSITIPDSVTSIGDYAFRDCSSLETVNFGENSKLTSIGEWAFYYCSSLTSITIPDSVTSIGSYAFYNCRNLTSITIPDSVTSIGDSAFRDCDSLTSITIPDSVTSIGDYAFSYCNSLTSITIPDSVTSIGSHAFFACMNLTIYCEVESKPSGWSYYWNSSDRSVYWAGKWEMVDGVPVPIESGVESVGLSEIGEDFGIGFDSLGFREELCFNDKRERKVV